MLRQSDLGQRPGETQPVQQTEDAYRGVQSSAQYANHFCGNLAISRHFIRPDLWTLRGADSRTTGGVCTRGTKAKRVVAGFALAATRSRCSVSAGVIVHVKVISTIDSLKLVWLT